jgi:Fe-S-cluster-containing dehydrogenase component
VEGHYPNGLIVMAMGFARVSVGEGAGFRTESYLGKGQVFGLAELVHNWRHPERPVAYQRSLRAVGHAQVLVIPTAFVEELILPSLPDEFLPPPIEPSAAGSNGGFLDRRSDALEFLLSRRLVNGTQAMVIDLQRCTSCDDCIRACASTHDGDPRFVRSGPRFGSTMVAGACMHCVDPVCMIGCPTGAIHRSAGGGEVVINQTTCVGCQTCARSCPYENIRMVAVRRPDGRPWEIAETREPVLKATKCDLCSEQLGGPACQRACPHDALERVDLSDATNLRGRFGE